MLPLFGSELQMEDSTTDLLVAVDEAKAVKWSIGLAEILHNECLEDWRAAKYAGRLQFSTSRHTGRVGRAYIRPFHAQAADPLPMVDSQCLQRACKWFLRYLEL